MIRRVTAQVSERSTRRGRLDGRSENQTLADMKKTGVRNVKYTAERAEKVECDGGARSYKANE